MGIDLLRGGRTANRNRRETKSSNAYLKLLIKVLIMLFSFILSSPEEQIAHSTKLFLEDSTNQDSIDIHFHFQESQRILREEKTPQSLQLLEQSQTITDF
jgi:hypothetical protein